MAQGVLPITTRNATFQQWRALLDSRSKRHRLGAFLVQGVRPITMAVSGGWPIRSLLCTAGNRSAWASEILRTARAGAVYELAPELMAELGGKQDPPELLAVAATLPDDLARIPVDPAMLVVAFDRPASPGNLGTVIRSADALGAAGVVITGHAVDLHDPKAVRSTTGSFFSTPAVHADSAAQVLGWVDGLRRRGVAMQVIGLSETGADELADCDLREPTLLVVGNEATGISRAWAQGCDRIARIRMSGAASSLNAAASASIALYEADRQRLVSPAGTPAPAPR